MQQHPVPQNIMSVEFQLIGNMTIKQFAYVGGGGILAFIFFSTPLPDFLKWPLVLGFGGLGAAFAFAPINDITLDRWLVAFIKAVYSPTKRVWRKEPKSLVFLLPEFGRLLNFSATSSSIRSKSRDKLTDYLSTLKGQKEKTPLDSMEESYVSSLDFGIALPQLAVPSEALQSISIPVATTEEPRAVEEKPESQAVSERIASFVSFKPVVTVRLPDKSIFVKPVSNVRIRSLHALPALEGTIVLPVRGEKVFNVSDSLKKRLSEKIHSLKLNIGSSNFGTQIFSNARPTNSGPNQAMPVSSQANNQNAPINSGARPVPYRTEPLSPLTPIPNSPLVGQTGTKPEVSNIDNSAEVARIKGQISTEVASTVESFKRIASENRSLQDEMEKIKRSQVQTSLSTRQELDKIVAEYKTQLEKLRVEREALFNQLGNIQAQSVQFQQKAASTSTLEQELGELKSKMSALEQEKFESEKHAQTLRESLSGLQQQLQDQFKELSPTPGNSSESTPTLAPASPVPTKIKVVEPRRAEGKMAPQITTVPNVVNGIVRDKNGLLLPDVIIVVKDAKDNPARALKTNKIGQFAISTPLPSGVYLIELEKDGQEFDIIQVKLAGEILLPIEIQAK